MSDVETGTERLIGRKEGHIGWLTFNNPLRRNAMSLDMWEGVPRVIEAFEADPEIRVVVLTGAGDKAFVSGADISQFEEQRANKEAEANYSAKTAAAHAAMSGLSKPTIAMIRGYCIGGGMAVALTADMRICVPESRFAIPAARLGLGYGFDGVRTLVDLVGPAYAKEIFLTARQFTSEEALRIGLVNRVVPAEDLETVVRDYARMIGENAPLTMKAAKMAVRESLRDPGHRRLDALGAVIDACFDSADYAEGRIAFMEKRKPTFEGR